MDLELSEALEKYDTAASAKDRAVAAVELAESVRECLDRGLIASDENDGTSQSGTGNNGVAFQSVSPGHGTIGVGMTIYRQGYPVTVDGVIYSTAMNAFQAMKAPKELRKTFADVTWDVAVAMGRNQVIDIASWDANRETLMESILTAQAKQNPGFKKIVLEHGNKNLVENSMGDAFWPTALPKVWKNVRANLKKQDDDGGEEEDDEHDEDDESDLDDEDYSHITSSQGLKCPAKRPLPS